MYTQQAIEKAIEGGWKNKPALQYVDARFPIKSDIVTLDCTLLDPQFWMALGKAENWSTTNVYQTFFWKDKKGSTSGSIPEWQAYWHRFIEALAAGESAESFFESLLSDTLTSNKE